MKTTILNQSRVAQIITAKGTPSRNWFNRRKNHVIRNTADHITHGICAICKTGLAALGLLLATSAFAQVAGTIQLTGSMDTYLNYTYTDIGGNSHSACVSPYPATITYNTQSYPVFLTCLDANSTTYLGNTYQGYWNVDFASFSVAEREASWLVDQLDGLTNVTADLATVGPISLAVWSVMLPSSNTPAPPVALNAVAQNWLDQAAAAVAGGYTADNMIFTSTDTTTQRLMCNSPSNPPSPIPEPSGILLGMGALGLCVARRTWTWDRVVGVSSHRPTYGPAVAGTHRAAIWKSIVKSLVDYAAGDKWADCNRSALAC